MKLEITDTVEVRTEKVLKTIAKMALVPGWVIHRSVCDLCLFEYERGEPVCVVELEGGKVLYCHNKCVEERTR